MLRMAPAQIRAAALKVNKGRPGLWVHRALRVRLVRPDPRVRLVPQAPLDPPVLQGLQDRLDRKDLQVRKVR